MASKPSPTVVTAPDDGAPAKVVVGTGGRPQTQKGMFGFAHDYQSKATIKATQLATSLPVGTSIQEAAKCMLTTGQYTVLITDQDSQLKGILTDTDIVKKVVSEGRNPAEMRVEDFMTPNPQTIPSGTLCVDALKLMVENKFRHIPVVRPDGTLDGITDLPRCLYDALATLEDTFLEAQKAMDVFSGLQQAGGDDDDMSCSPLDSVLHEVMDPTVEDVLLREGGEDLDQSSTVQSAAGLMKSKGFSAVLITSRTGRPHPKLLGILTSKDICRRVVAKGLNAQELTFDRRTGAPTVMTPNPLTIPMDTSIVEALHMMHKSLYSHLPVVDHSGHSVGVVDIVKLSMHLHDLISKVKRQCTVQSLFSMWEESQSATVVGDGGWSPGALGIDDIEQIPLHKLSGEGTPPRGGYEDDLDQYYANEPQSNFQPWDTMSQDNRSVVSGLTMTSSRTGMFKIFDGVDIQRFHFNPSANPDFEEFRNRVCKKLGIDCWASYDMLSLFYFDGEGDEIKMTDSFSLQEAINEGQQLGKDIELVAVLNANKPNERVFSRRPRGSKANGGGGKTGGDILAGVSDAPVQWALAVGGGAVVVATIAWLVTKMNR